MKNYYEILEITPEASEEVVKAAYKALVKRMHPDNGGQNISGQKTLEDVNEAYSVLSNKEKKAEYDYRLQNEKQASSTYVNDETETFYTNHENDSVKVEDKKDNLAIIVTGVILSIIFKVMGLPRWLLITSLCVMVLGIAGFITPYIIDLIKRFPYARSHWKKEDTENISSLISVVGIRIILALFDIHNFISGIVTFLTVCVIILVVIKFVEIIVKADEC